MKKVLFIMTLVFGVLTFVGAGYVLYNRGQVNAGYAVIPMIFCLGCLSFNNILKRNEDKSMERCMKKKRGILLIFLIAGIVLSVGAYGVFNEIFPKAELICAPEINDITKVSVALNTDDDFVVDDMNLGDLFAIFSEAKPTRQQSLNDYPTFKPFYRIEIQTEERSYRYFIYEDAAHVYIEIPYEGIYISDMQILDFVLDYFEE